MYAHNGICRKNICHLSSSPREHARSGFQEHGGRSLDLLPGGLLDKTGPVKMAIKDSPICGVEIHAVPCNVDVTTAAAALNDLSRLGRNGLPRLTVQVDVIGHPDLPFYVQRNLGFMSLHAHS